MTIIFIDYFDTLVHRSIPPEEIKKLWAILLSKQLGLVIDLYDIRFKSEAELCAKNYALHNESEFIYDDMCREVYSKIVDCISISENKFISICRDVELDLEKQAQYLNSENLEFIRNAKLMNQKVYLVSDFYFDRALFVEMLSYHNISEYFDDVFISCDFIASKRTGRLFEVLKERLGIDFTQNCMMIGDNEVSDVINPIQNGLSSRHSNASKNHNYYQSIANQNEFNKIVDSFNDLYLPTSGLVYPQIALALYLFITKLTDKLTTLGIKDVLFMAREGEFIKKVFDRYVSIRNYEINSHYLYVSRRATFLPSLKKLEDEDFHVLFRQYINISVEEFLLNLNFLPEHINKISGDFDIKVRIIDFPNSKEFAKLKANKIFQEHYEKNRQQQKENITEHFKSFNICLDNICVVDVGWKGSIQDNLASIFKNSNITGLYFGLNLPTENKLNSSKIGLMFDVDKALDANSTGSIYNICTSIFEIVLGASHGTTLRYSDNGQPVLLTNELEQELYDTKISVIQEQIFEYIKLVDMIVLWQNISKNELQSYVNEKYLDFILHPSIKQLKIYDKLYHVESFGVHEVTEFRQENKRILVSLVQLLKNPSLFLQDTFWPAHKLYSTGLGFLLPLYKFYKSRKLKK